MDKAIFCLAKESKANKIVQKLKSEGFSDKDISVLYKDINLKTNEFSFKGFTEARRSMEDIDFAEIRTTEVEHSKAPEGAAMGGTAGGLIGGAIGLLAGIGALTIPGLGPFIAAGPIMATLAGSAVGGSIGLLTGALVGLGIPEYEAIHYAEKLKNPQMVLLSVHAMNLDGIEKAKELFERNGGEDISYSRETVASSHNERRR